MSNAATRRPIFQAQPRLLALAAAALCASTGINAQVQAKESTMEEVVVSASGFEQELKDAPASISVVTRKELETRNFRDLAEALQGVEGIDVMGGTGKTGGLDISIRGMPSDYTLILIDGRRQNVAGDVTPNGFGAALTSFMPPLSAIERIEVIRGPMSTLYGSDAMGGVINIITRKVAKQWMGSIRTEATLQERSSSGNIYQSNFYLSGPIQTDLLGLSIYGNYNKRGEDNILNGYNDYDNRALNVKLALTPNKDHDIIAELGTGKQHYTSTPGKTLAATAALSDRQFERDNFSLQHKGRWGWASSDTYLQQEKTRNLSRDMTIKNTVFNSSWVAPLGANHLLTTGVSYNEQDLTDTTTNTLPNASRTSINRSQWAVFAEDEWRLHKDFALTGGLRYDHDSQAGGQVSPRLYGVWNLAPQWTVKGGVSTGFRAPSLRQTVGDWGQSSRGGNIYGNPDLKPETSLTKEIGVLYDSGAGTTAGLTVFDNEFEDKITRVACPSCGPLNSSGRVPTTNINVDNAITRGVEASLGTQLSKTLRLKTNYTFTKSEQKSGEFAGQPLSQLPGQFIHAAAALDDGACIFAVAVFLQRCRGGAQFFGTAADGRGHGVSRVRADDGY